jgi:hypothetical protein
MFDKEKRKFPLKKNEPDDIVGTVYCNENSEEYDNIIENTDMFPYISPLPKYRRTPEPPII